MDKQDSVTSSQVVVSPLPFKLLLSCPLGLSPSQVSVNFSESHDRIPHSDTALEDSIHEIWDQRVQENGRLFNGQKFRYEGYRLHGGAGFSEQSHVCLHLGLTDYRTFVGTNLNPLWERFLVPAEDDYIRCQHTSSPLGNGAVVETSDDKIVVLRRSDNVGEFPRHFVFPGGHPEPKEASIEIQQSSKEAIDREDVNKRVSQEMFDSIIREVVEEIGVPAASLCDPLFIGLSRREMNVRPAAFFFIKCTLPSEEIQMLYSQAEDGYESTQLYTVSSIELEEMVSRMPGCHQGGFALFKLMIESSKIARENL